jgi:hypothetical protein
MRALAGEVADGGDENIEELCRLGYMSGPACDAFGGGDGHGHGEGGH